MALNEYQLHLQVADYFRRCLDPRIPAWHTGQTAINARHGATLKRLGVKAGVPDWALIIAPHGRIAFIELKAGNGKQSPAQIVFEECARAAGGWYAVCRSLDDVRGVLAAWGVGTR